MRFPPPDFFRSSLPNIQDNFVIFQYSRGKGFYLFFKECRDFFGSDFSFFGSRYWVFQDFFAFSSHTVLLSGFFTMVLTLKPEKYQIYSSVLSQLFQKYAKFIVPLTFYGYGQLFSCADFSRVIGHSFSKPYFFMQLFRFFSFFVVFFLFSFFFMVYKRLFAHMVQQFFLQTRRAVSIDSTAATSPELNWVT